jgi:fimbrial chaperone protein
VAGRLHKKRATPALLLALALATSLAGARGARGAAFNVKPTQITLSPKVTSAMFSVLNQSGQTTRFQLSVFVWNQNARGEMQLTPTKDVVFFPTLLSLAPGEERKVRVGSTLPAGALEKTYRIFVEELPPAGSAKPDAKSSPEIKVLTRMGIPIFVQPAAPSTGGQIQPKTLRSDKLAFEVKNTGNVHFQVRQASVRGIGPGNESLFERTVPGWYVLAGGSRVFEVEAPKNVCAKTKSLSFVVETEKATLKSELDTRTGICGP